MNARAKFANVLISLVWTAVFVGPLYVFCARYVSLIGLYTSFAIAAVFLVLPKALLQRLALSKHIAMYQHLRVPRLIPLTQDAAWLRHITGSRQRLMPRDNTAIERFERDTWMRERFHLSLLAFYSLCTVAALVHAQFLLACGLVLSNIIYNLYPIWLQQYLRLRVARFRPRSREGLHRKS